MSVPIQDHARATERLRAFMDGDAICITLDNFVDLQCSPAVFIGPGEKLYTILRPWVDVVENPTNHLPFADQCSIAKQLLKPQGSNT